VSVIDSGSALDEMDMSSVAHIDCRSGAILNFVEMVVEKVCANNDPMFVATTMDRYGLACYSCEPVVMFRTSIFQSGTSYKLMNMFLPSCGSIICIFRSGFAIQKSYPVWIDIPVYIVEHANTSINFGAYTYYASL
jgi:hypothetical protein